MTASAETIAQLRDIVTSAKSVPMSASCMVNRAEVLGLLDRLDAAVSAEFADASSLLGEREATLDQARQEAEQILADARARAEGLVAEESVHVEAAARAERLTSETESEAEEIKREADAYVDARIAELEAGLSKTMSQIQTMRARLAERSKLDERFAE